MSCKLLHAFKTPLHMCGFALSRQLLSCSGWFLYKQELASSTHHLQMNDEWTKLTNGHMCLRLGSWRQHLSPGASLCCRCIQS